MILELALSTALTTSSLTGGTSETAKYVEGKRRNFREHVEHSQTFGSALEKARQELAQLANECMEPNWDGYGASAINPAAYRNACRFLENLPLGVGVPSPGVDPDGELTFEWHRGPRRTLSISVSEEGNLTYAALIGSSRAHGREPFLGNIPRVIAELVSRVDAGV
jgi:hypothetical protein